MKAVHSKVMFCAATFLSLAIPSCAQQPCVKASVYANLRVSEGKLLLADLLKESCLALREAASRVVLGRAPLPGDPRIFEGEQVRRMLTEVSRDMENGNADLDFDVPERVSVHRASTNSQIRISNAAPAKKSSVTQALVVPGQTVTLVWDQEGIRVILPAICLDRGGPGDAVRIRMKNSGKIWHAKVAPDGMLRAIL
jgi:hypothetical protein